MTLIPSPISNARRPARPAGRLLAGVGLAAAVLLGVAAGPADAERPTEVAGDPHSPQVARRAAAALSGLERAAVSGLASDQRAFERQLTMTARLTAAELGVSEPGMSDAWLAADADHQVALLTALTQLGVEYQSATSEPGVGFDCSGLMFYAWGEAGVTLARQSGAQISDADQRQLDTAMAGDLAQYPGHVMMYLGVPRAFVHAANPESDVELWRASEERAESLRYGDPSHV